MEITGKIIAICEKQSGISKKSGEPWASQEYVIETHEQYPKKICFKVFGEDKISRMNIQEGEELTVSFDIDSREYNSRWYNEILAWKVNRPTGEGQQPTETDPFSEPQSDDNPPF